MRKKKETKTPRAFRHTKYSSTTEWNQQPSKLNRSGESLFKVKLTYVNQLKNMKEKLASVCGPRVMWEAGEVIK